MVLYLSLHDRLKNQHEAIRNIIHGLDESHLMAQRESDKWSIHGNIAHLAKLRNLYIERIDKILSQNEPLLQSYLAENDPEFKNWQMLDAEELLRRLDGDRKQIYNTAIKLSDTQLGRIGIHTNMGRLTIVDWLESMLLHEGHHIWAVFGLVHNPAMK